MKNYVEKCKNNNTEYLKELKTQAILRDNYNYMLNQAKTCLAYITQKSVFSSKYLSLSPSIPYIITYYDAMVRDRMKETNVQIPGYSTEMFMSLLLFSTDELYYNILEDEEILETIDSCIVDAKKEKMNLENKLYGTSRQNIPQDDIAVEVANNIQFDLIRTFITGKICLYSDYDYNDVLFYNFSEIIKSYCKEFDVPKEKQKEVINYLIKNITSSLVRNPLLDNLIKYQNADRKEEMITEIIKKLNKIPDKDSYDMGEMINLSELKVHNILRKTKKI